MIELCVSGGQTGSDQAGWRAAKATGIATTGWMPRNFLTETGPRPEFAEMYGAKSHRSASYRDRTISNIGLADMTLLFGDPRSPGGRLVQNEAIDINHPVTVIGDPCKMPPAYVATIIRRYGDVRAINVAGNRESKAPGIGAWVEAYMLELFRILKGD